MALPATPADVVNTVVNAVNTAVDTYDDLVDRSVVSLTQYTAQTSIRSSAYIDGNIVNEPITSDCLKVAHALVATFVLTALKLNAYVGNGKKVTDILKVVGEELAPYISVTAALEAAGATKNLPVVYDPKNASDTVTVKLAEDLGLPIGRLIELPIIGTDGKATGQSISLNIQVMPHVVPAQLMDKLINANTVPTFAQRYLQWRAKEISFWKDFVFGVDMVNNRKRLEQMDPTGVLANALSFKNQKYLQIMLNQARSSDNRRRNIANGIVIVSSETVARAKAETGIDIGNANYVEQYMLSSMAMMLFIVDNVYNRVKVWYYGIPTPGEYTFEQMKANAKKGPETDIVSLLAAMAQQKPPRF